MPATVETDPPGIWCMFSDGSTADPQLVVMATGYRPRFEFLPDDYLGGDPENPRLHLQLVNPAYPTFAVVGLIQPYSGQFSLVHWQSVLVAKLLHVGAGRFAGYPPPGRAVRADRGGAR